MQQVLHTYFCSAGWDSPGDFKVVLGEHHLGQNSGAEVTRNVAEIIRVRELQ